MTRRFLSLLCALALCLGLTPATALAAGENAPKNLYVGNQNVKGGDDTTYWTTDDSGALTQSNESAAWNVKYDPNSATLTLREATIVGENNYESVPYGAGIYAECSSGSSVSLTIELIGTNTITGSYGIYLDGNQGNAICTDASVLIKNGNESGESGSLTVNDASNYGIYIISGTGNASLTIENASIVANATSTYSGSGVCVQSGASSKDSPALSLAVNGGSLTASGGAGGEGIEFYVGAYEAPSATTSLTVTDNAIVDARTGGISASGVSVNPTVNIGSTGSTGGIVFDGTEGTVYGDVTLQDDLEIASGETLTVPEGSSLTSNNKLTNNGTVTIENGGALTDAGAVTNNSTINVEDGGKLEGTPTGGTVVNAPTITVQPANQTETEGNVANFAVTATGENLSYQWQYSVDNGTNWNDISGATSSSYTAGAATLEMNDHQYRCVVSNSAGSVTSDAATLKVNAATVPVTGVTLDKASLSLYTGGTATLAATVEPNDATNKNVTWSSDKPDVATVDGNGKVTAVAPGTATITATAANGGKTATCTVTVRRYVPPAPAKTPSQQALDKIESADDGDTVTVSLSAGDTVLDAEVFEALAGRDVTLEAKLPGGAVWAVSGLDVPEGADFADVDMGVTMGVDAIPGDVVDAVTGEAGTVQLALAHDGPFGFEMTLTTSVGAESAGLWANLYRYDEAAGRMVFQAVAKVGEDGGVALSFDHASQYAIVLDAVSHELPFSDVSPSDWFANPVGTAFRAGLMVGYDDSSLFGPEDELTRAQAATVLCRALGAGAQSPACGMADVDPGAWYAGSVDWAVSSGLMVGYGDGSGLFGPDDALIREQLAVVLWRAAGSPDAGPYDGSAFSDGAGASQWAEPALAWAVESGVLKGSDDGAGGTGLRPTEAVTRAEMATMLARWIRSE